MASGLKSIQYCIKLACAGESHAKQVVTTANFFVVAWMRFGELAFPEWADLQNELECSVEDAKKLFGVGVAAVDNYVYSTEYPSKREEFSEAYANEHYSDADFVKNIRAAMLPQ